MELSTQHHEMGKYSLRWKDHVKVTAITANRFLKDWTDVHHVRLTLYNNVKNTEELHFILYSQNSSSRDDDYYVVKFTLDWVGPRELEWTKEQFGEVRFPLGWDTITSMRFDSQWSKTQQASSDVFFDSLQFFREDGTEIDGFNGLEQYLPSVNHDRTVFYDLKACSVPISLFHAVSIIRHNAKNPIVQLLKSHSESSNFVSSFESSGKSYVITTEAETITVNPGNLDSDKPCTSVKRVSSKKGTVTTYLGCSSVSLSESESDLTVSLFPGGNSYINLKTTPLENSAVSDSAGFSIVKLTGSSITGLNISSCSGIQDFTVSFNGETLDSVGEEKTDSCLTKSFSISINPSMVGDFKISLIKENTLSDARGRHHTEYSVLVVLALFLLYLFI